MWSDGVMGFGHGLFGPFMLVVWVILIVLIVVALRFLLGTGRAGGGEDIGERRTPLDVLQDRYARGEIDDEEYERRRRKLAGE